MFSSIHCRGKSRVHPADVCSIYTVEENPGSIPQRCAVFTLQKKIQGPSRWLVQYLHRRRKPLDSMRTFSWFVSYPRLSPQFQFSLFAAALGMYLCGGNRWFHSQSTYGGIDEIGECIWSLIWSVNCNFVSYGKNSERGWASTLHPPPPTLNSQSWWNVRQNSAVATLCVLCGFILADMYITMCITVWGKKMQNMYSVASIVWAVDILSSSKLNITIYLTESRKEAET